MKLRSLVFVFLFLAVGCSKKRDVQPETTFDPCESLREINPHCGWKPHWSHIEGPTNAIDGTKSEFLLLESSDPEGNNGKLQYADLRICFKNKQICGGDSISVGVTVHGMLQPVSYPRNYSTPVRWKFDDEQPVREVWGISNDHDTLFPFGHEKRFFSQLLTHNKLVLEFSYYQKAPRTITFDLPGLADVVRTNTLQDPTGEVRAFERRHQEVRAEHLAQITGELKQREQEQAAEEQERAAEEKRLAALRERCVAFTNGSVAKVQAKTIALPPKECRDVLGWTRDSYLDALYDLQK